LAPSDEFLSVGQGYGSIESSSKAFAHQRSKGRVVTADAFVDLLQDVLAFFTRYALHEDSISGTLHVELVSD
jgi:hypothetical protein